MVDTLEYLAQRFNLNYNQKLPIHITNINRTIMAQVLNELGMKVGAEVGVAQGYHAETLCQCIPGVKLYCVDIWERYPGYREYTNRIGRYYLDAQKRLAPYDCVLVKKFSIDAVRDFSDESLDFVYIDAAHDFMNVAIDVSKWHRKVRKGGIMFGHDFKRFNRYKGKYIVDVKDVVPAYCYAREVNPWFVLDNDIVDDKFGHDNPGWMFVRGSEDVL